MSRPRRLILGLALAAVLALAFFAPGVEDALGRMQSYPLLSLAHLLAALGLGVWAGRLGDPALLLLPVAFVLGAGFGIALAVEGWPMLPLVEPMIWASVPVFTLGAASAARQPLGETTGLAVLFRLFHGYALGGGPLSSGGVLSG